MIPSYSIALLLCLEFTFLCCHEPWKVAQEGCEKKIHSCVSRWLQVISPIFKITFFPKGRQITQIIKRTSSRGVREFRILRFIFVQMFSSKSPNYSFFPAIPLLSRVWRGVCCNSEMRTSRPTSNFYPCSLCGKKKKGFP